MTTLNITILPANCECSRIEETPIAKPKWRLASKTVFTALVIMGVPAVAEAGQCDASGGLRYLGVTSNNAKSVWLSFTSPGSFELEAAQGNQTVDQWSKSKKGLRLSLSPNVSSGNGGTHKLLDVGGNKPCLLDSQNQKGGFVFPPISRPPPGWIRPPTGVMPTLPTIPGGGGNPPTGVMPTLPTLPGGGGNPPTGVMPTLPTVVTPTNTEAIQLVNTTIPITPCLTPSHDEGEAVSGSRPQNCAEVTPATSSNEEVGSVPITAGREFGVEALWSVWADTRYLNSSDHRDGLDMDGNINTFVVGADRRVSDDLVAGVSMQGVYSRSNGFNNAMTSDSTGFVISPYIAYQLSHNWAIDASFGYGRTENNQQLSVLEGEYTAHSYSVSLVANGQYPMGEAFIRPKLSFYYDHTRADGYDMSGNIFNIPIILSMPKSSYNYGIVETSAEVNQTFITSGGIPIMPYAELTARYEFERVNDGYITTGNLAQASTSPWSGALRAGTRAMITRSTNVEASAGYLSLGQNGLDVWELRLFLSHSF